MLQKKNMDGGFCVYVCVFVVFAQMIHHTASLAFSFQCSFFVAKLAERNKKKKKK